MLGDRQVTLPGYEATLGVTINTAAAAIWPWLVQMGHRRGGLYSYDLALVPAGSGQTRLISRSRVKSPGGIRSRITMLLIEPAAFLMTRRMLMGIKRRAESMVLAERKAA